MNRMKNKSFTWLALAGLVALINACTVTKDTVYFNDIPSIPDAMNMEVAEFTEPVIQVDDIISVQIQVVDVTGATILNQGADMAIQGMSTAQNTQAREVPGFLVDKDGTITLPMVGPVKVAGLTTQEAKEVITKAVAVNYNDPTVQVRFANFKITVLGEVARPATYTVPNQKVTVLDALGMAGDLTIYGKRENVLLIRDQGGQKEFVRFNLNSADLFKSPHFYLRQNDVLYIEPNKAKVTASESSRWQVAGVIASIASVIAVIITRF